MERFFEYVVMLLGGVVGWFVGKFEPAFPLIYVAIAFIVYDSWTAYELDKRVKRRYPDRKKRPARYVSYKAWDMVPTMIESFVIILLMYAAQKWIFVDLYIPLSYIAAGVICAVQLLSIAENKSSCRQPGDKGYRVWKTLARFVIDKTERHFDIEIEKGNTILDKDDN